MIISVYNQFELFQKESRNKTTIMLSTVCIGVNLVNISATRAARLLTIPLVHLRLRECKLVASLLISPLTLGVPIHHIADTLVAGLGHLQLDILNRVDEPGASCAKWSISSLFSLSFDSL